jgi:N-acetylmuramoyl-L-alanine amidase
MKVISWLIYGFCFLAPLLLQPIESLGQSKGHLILVGSDGDTLDITVFDTGGYRTVTHVALEEMGWDVEIDSESLKATISETDRVRFLFDSPFFYWNNDLLQLVNSPVMEGRSAQIPIQFFLDFVPVRLGAGYVLTNGQESNLGEEPKAGEKTQIVEAEAEPVVDLPDEGDVARDGETNVDLRRLVIVDPGHGGKDPGTTGAGGRREKDIALSVSRELVRELEKDENIEVYMTRDRDVFVPLWERGEQAMLQKGDGLAIFLSIHVNAAPNSPSVRGFETYFLSEARTEHEKRVAANENAPLRLYAGEKEDAETPDLGFILRELRNLNHQHWSANLAETIQEQLRIVHMGPDRGVKQGPFAVITNVLMPAVLVEIGFVSNREEEREMSRSEFQRRIGKALADAVRGFYERYPPGQEVTGINGNY